MMMGFRRATGSNNVGRASKRRPFVLQSLRGDLSASTPFVGRSARLTVQLIVVTMVQPRRFLAAPAVRIELRIGR